MKVKIQARQIDTKEFNEWLKVNAPGCVSIIHTESETVLDYLQIAPVTVESIVEKYNTMPIYSDLDKARTALKSNINELRDSIIKSTFEHEIDGNRRRFDCDDRSAIRLSALANGASYFLAQQRPFEQTWRDANNNNVVLSAEAALDLFASARLHEENTVFKAAHIKDEIIDNFSEADIVDKDAKTLWEETEWPLT